jgi:hypothetical protein
LPTNTDFTRAMYARDAIRRLAAKGVYPITQTDLDAEVKAMQEEVRARREGGRIAELERRLRRLEDERDDEIDPYR